jgi:hypothetical protein
MSLDAWNDKATEPDMVKILVRMAGAGAATPTKVRGRGVTLNRTGAGIVTMTFNESQSNFGTFIGCVFGYDSATQANLKGYTAVVSPPVASGLTMVSTLNITNNADTLADLAAGQNLTLLLMFTRTSAS